MSKEDAVKPGSLVIEQSAVSGLSRLVCGGAVFRCTTVQMYGEALRLEGGVD